MTEAQKAAEEYAVPKFSFGGHRDEIMEAFLAGVEWSSKNKQKYKDVLAHIINGTNIYEVAEQIALEALKEK
jgi:hypothetical protein